MQKIRKIVRAVSEKTALPTNQPTNQPIITNNTDLIGPRWCQSNKNWYFTKTKSWSVNTFQRQATCKFLYIKLS